MKYVAKERFADLQDNKYIYEAGDEFPRAGVTVTEDRLKTLSGDQNAANRPLIMKVSNEKAEAAKSVTNDVIKASHQNEVVEEPKIEETTVEKPKAEKNVVTKKTTKKPATKRTTKKNAN